MRLRVVCGFCLLGTIAASGCFAFDWGYQGTASGGGGGAGSSAGGSTSTSNPTTGGGGGSGGSPPVTTLFFGEGSRLRAHYYDFGGGIKDLVNWYDTKLKVNCTFTTFSDGNAACIPRVFDATTYFADSSCTQPLITYGGSSLCPGTNYGVVNDPTPTCDPPTTSGVRSVNLPGTVNRAGDPYTGGAVYLRNGTNTCAIASVSGVFRYRGDAIERTTFVTAKLEDAPRGQALTQKILRGTDGSWQISRVFDADGPCNLREVNGVEICLSVYGGFAEDSLFSDAMCTMGTIGNFSNVALCKPPGYIRYQKAGACLPTTQFFAAGAVVTPSPSFYYLSGTTCTLNPTTNENVLTQGDEIPLSAFPLATVETIGDGRVKETFFGTGKTEALALPSAHLDSAAGNASCSIYRFDSDKVIRCVDNAAVAMTYFKDSSCTEPAGFAYKNSCAPVVTPKYGIVYSSHNDPCDPVSHASKLVKVKKSDRAAYSLNQGNCTAVDTTNIDSVYIVDGDYPISSLSVVEEISP